MAERLIQSSREQYQLACDVQRQIRRCFTAYQRAGKLWVEPRAIRRAMLVTKNMHARYAAGDLRHTASEVKAQEEVMEWVYIMFCEVSGRTPKPRARVLREFAEQN